MQDMDSDLVDLVDLLDKPMRIKDLANRVTMGSIPKLLDI
jgi:hypothetical protein